MRDVKYSDIGGKRIQVRRYKELTASGKGEFPFLPVDTHEIELTGEYLRDKAVCAEWDINLIDDRPG